jgi:hypothetical protein
MTDAELDTVYTALAEAIGSVGTAKTPLLLSTLSLSLLAKHGDAKTGLELIEQAKQLVTQP